MIKFICIIDGLVTIKELDASISYNPKLKYNIEVKSSIDPTIVYKREPYHEDSLDINAILSPEEYQELYNLLNSPAGNGLEGAVFYVEFEYNGAIKQLPVEVDSLPPMSDYQRYGNDMPKFSLVSRYKSYTPIDVSVIYGYGASYGSLYGF